MASKKSTQEPTADITNLHSSISEQTVLSAIFSNPELIESCEDIASADIFMYEAHAQVYEAIKDISDSKKEVSLSSVLAHLELRGQDVDVEYITAIAYLHQPETAFNHHLGILVDLHTRRKIVDAGRDLSYRATNLDLEIDEILFEHQSAIDNKHTAQKTLSEPLFIDSDLEDTSTIKTYPTHIPLMNQYCMPMQGQLFVIGAGTNVGKTALSLSLGFEWAMKGFRVLYFSCEMQRRQLSLRAYSYLRVATKRELYKAFSNYEPDKVLAKVIERRIQEKAPLLKIINDNMRVYSHGFPTVYDIREQVRSDNYPDIVIVDYIQILKSTKDQPRYLEISDRVLGLKSIAMNPRHPCLVLTMSQLSSQKNSEGHVVSTSAREGKDIENHADVFLELKKNSHIISETAKPVEELTLEVRKSRDGPKGKAILCFEGDHQTFAQCRLSEYNKMYPSSVSLQQECETNGNT